MDAIDLLEQRIAALELKVNPIEVTTAPSKSISDMLIQVNSLITSALSCRDVVTAIFTRMSELNEYLDPSFSERQLDTNAKKQFILAIYPEVKKCAESMNKLKKLVPILDQQTLNNVPSLVPKLEQLAISNLELQDDNENVTKNVSEALRQYNEIIMSISRTFIHLDEIVRRLELEIQPKNLID